MVRLGPIAAKALSGSGQPDQDTIERTLGRAIAYYLGPGRGSAAGWAFPKFLVPAAEPSGSAAVPLGRAAWDEIAIEAERQAIEPDSLVQHAALFYGAARDAGRLPDGDLDGLDQESGAAA
jgi:hypothetical protein